MCDTLTLVEEGINMKYSQAFIVVASKAPIYHYKNMHLKSNV